MTAREIMMLHADIMSLQELLSISYKDASHWLYMSKWEFKSSWKLLVLCNLEDTLELMMMPVMVLMLMLMLMPMMVWTLTQNNYLVLYFSYFMDVFISIHHSDTYQVQLRHPK